MEEVIYRLLFFVNSSREKDVYYTIAWTMLENINQVPKFNINQLADMCYTSPATISRFIKKLDYESFGDFKNKLENTIRYYNDQLSFNLKLIDNKSIRPSTIENEFYDLLIDNLEQSRKNINMRSLDKLLELIYTHNKIAFFGMQFSQYIAMEIQAKFIALGKLATAFVDFQEQLKHIEELDENSLVIMLSVAGRVARSDLIKSIKRKKAKLAVITQDPDAERFKEADLVINFGNPDIKSVESIVLGRYTLLSIMDILYYRYGQLYNHRNS